MTNSLRDVITIPVPQDRLEAIRQATAAEADAFRAGEPEQPIGVEQEYAVYRIASEGVLSLLADQRVRGASELLNKMEEAAKKEPVTDIYTASMPSKLEEISDESDGSDFPTEKESMAQLAEATGAVAHTIAAAELGHKSTALSISRAHRELENPKTKWAIGTIADHTLNTLLEEFETAQAEERASA